MLTSAPGPEEVARVRGAGSGLPERTSLPERVTSGDQCRCTPEVRQELTSHGTTGHPPRLGRFTRRPRAARRPLALRPSDETRQDAFGLVRRPEPKCNPRRDPPPRLAPRSGGSVIGLSLVDLVQHPPRVALERDLAVHGHPDSWCRRLSQLGAHLGLATRLDPSDASLRGRAGGTACTSRSGRSPQTGRPERTCRTGHRRSGGSRRPLFALHPDRTPRTRLPRVRTHSCPDEPAHKTDEQGTHPGPHPGQDDHSDPLSGPVFVRPLRLHPASVSRVKDSKQQGREGDGSREVARRSRVGKTLGGSAGRLAGTVRSVRGPDSSPLRRRGLDASCKP